MSVQTYRVYADDIPYEQLTVTVDGTLMTVDGPYWFGEGLLVNDRYIGRAYYKNPHGEPASPLKPVFHDMDFLGDDFDGEAVFSTGAVDLEWRLEV